jgi:peroxiredoxin
MRLNGFVTIVVFFYFAALSAQPLTISGVIHGGENQEVRLMSFGDQISFKPVILGRAIVSPSGFFKMTAEIQEPLIANIDISFYSGAIAIMPGKDYEIVCDPISLVNEFRPLYQKEHLNFEILEEPDPYLNFWLSSFEGRYYNFVSGHFESFSKRRDPAILIGFRSEMEEEYGKVENEFFQVYLDYKIATLELSTAPSRKAIIFGQYLKDRMVHYNNPEYMFFFNTFFDQYLPGNNRFVSRRDLDVTINGQANYHILMDTLGKDTLLRNEVIRELVLLKTLKELYRHPSFDGNSILSILNQVANQSKFSEHRKIAANLLHEMKLLEVGYPAPQFELPDLDGGNVSLSSLQGKPVYLFFMTTQSYGCLVEFERMEELHKIYGNDIHFVTVSLDESPEVTDRIRKQYQLNWLFLYNGSSFDLINKYRIKTYPTFVLITGDGNIAEYPAFKPSEIIEQSFQNLLK